MAGNDVSVRCDVRGYPRPYVTWTKDGVEIQQSQRIRISGKYLFGKSTRYSIKIH